MKTTKLAIMYDFDKTLSPKDMQEFSFIPSLGIEPAQFWSEVTALAAQQGQPDGAADPPQRFCCAGEKCQAVSGSGKMVPPNQ